ncbi:MAG: MotA/TolQ/ExbB proton channel family protein [Bdellovibrionales bacterium]|nr:MotA/TolQ/ExbB proton channel family protein [Bdellovibrionales bacterium]
MDGAKLDILHIIWQSGIVVKIVLGLLIASSVYSWAIILKKKKMFAEAQENNEKFFEIYNNSENLKDIMLKSEMLPFSPYKALYTNGYKELVKMKEAYVGQHQKSGLSFHFQNFGMGVLERGLKKGANETNEELSKTLSTLASIGSVSPFVGLFGTVWGIIDAFSGLAGGGGSIDAVAPGIAEALVATAVGLAAAIPAVWFYNHFNSVNERFNSEMESFGQDFINVVERSIVE